MKTRFLNNPDYEFTKVNNASQACGPLVKWATAQVSLIKTTFNIYTQNILQYLVSCFGC